ncbi:MAG: orotidine-5'-phosphate decarboxylase [Peptococcaceae bacterium]|jgi:orotidine-5'-phosphate decarboxylase|nr:orotidine-5'-phosphate decarboxylase [Peptococcaceae bacterium]
MAGFKNPLIIALDVDSIDQALALTDRIGAYAGGFKVGMQLYYSAGQEIMRLLRERNLPVFADLKLHDIPNTVAGASKALTRQGASILNVHASGGKAMMQAAAAAVREESVKAGIMRPKVLAVTVLTSIDQQVFLQEMGHTGAIREQVVNWARLAQEAGLDGVVASPLEISAIREACGADFIILTPGIRPAGSELNDQKRTLTPGEAMQQGATYLVVGRPVTAAADPVAAVKEILQEIRESDVIK